MNLILLEERERADASCVTLTDARATHLLDVLRVTSGQTVRVGVIDGPLGTGTVQEAGSGHVTMQCVFETQTPPHPRVDVLLALPRPKVMRRLWAQFAALGVGQIILTNASRVERDYFDTHIVTEASYRPLLIEGLQQARDTRLPRVSIHRQFRILVEDHLGDLFPSGVRLVADPSGTLSPAVTSACCSLLAPRAAGTSSSSTCSRRTASRASEWVRARCAWTRHARPSLRSRTQR
jgi:RsmE family RNA methyltransferase